MQISILGQTYSIKSAEGSEIAQEAAEMVGGKIRELGQKMGPVAPEKLAILTAMNLAGELLQLKQETKEQKEKIQTRVSDLIKRVDQRIQQTKN